VVEKGHDATRRASTRPSKKPTRCHAFPLQHRKHHRPRTMTTRFEIRKRTLLQQLNAPDSEYHDLSPKGCIDAPIRTLIDEINSLEGLITTSSCSGRISVFCEGRKTESKSRLSEDIETQESRAGPGGKGGGGAWLFLSHDPVETAAPTSSHNFFSIFGLQKSSKQETPPKHVSTRRYIHLKFEPMVPISTPLHPDDFCITLISARSYTS